jgi:DUF1009 family protein
VDGDRSDGKSPLAIVAGGGDIPFSVAESLKAKGRPFVLFGIRGAADETRLAMYPHHWIGIGQIGRLERLARQAGCGEMVFIGTLTRPSLWRIRFDAAALLRLPRIIAAFRGGDDHLLRNIGRIFEEDGFRLIGAHEVAPQMLMPEGTLTKASPSARDRADIARALEALRTSATPDVGQAVVVADGEVVALETVEGTDDMLTRVAGLRATAKMSASSRTGVLVKAPKPTQDHRYDLPAIGPRTVSGVARAGLAGIAVIAGQSVVADLARMIEAADRETVFIVGIRSEG